MKTEKISGIQRDRIMAMEFGYPEYIPMTVGFLPATWKKYRKDLDDLVRRHPAIFGEQPQSSRDYDAITGTYLEGEHTDEWGCVWSNVAEGMEAIVTGHPLLRREDVYKLKAPPLDRSSLKHGLMYLRLCDLRGFKEIMIDFAEEPPELQMLIDIVLDHNMKLLQRHLEKSPEITYIGDDLGMQSGMPISPGKWRKYLKPCFAKMYGYCHEEGSSVYMHTDGHVIPIIPDLIECGADVLNLEAAANSLNDLAQVCKGKVCMDLYPDQRMFPSGKPEDIDFHIREIVEKLSAPEGGLWLQAECGPDVPLKNIEAICVAMEKYRTYYKNRHI